MLIIHVNGCSFIKMLFLGDRVASWGIVNLYQISEFEQAVHKTKEMF